MRYLPLLALSFVALSQRLDAQRFEGTITVRVGGPGGTGSMLTRMTAKGDKVLNVIALPGMGQEIRTITDNSARTLTSLTPFPPGMTLPPGVATAKGIIDVRPLPVPAKITPGATTKADIRKLGTSQTIAGTRCDDYEVTGETGQIVRMCLATSLGGLVPGALGGAATGGQPAPWTKALGNKPLMPLKIWQPDGTTILEVVAIKRQLVSPRLFDVPPGYITMATALKNRTSVPKP